ncbi:MAG: GNAT family N-acetyltransferase [Sandaracinaceae bacterium]|nr:GNAT family N-acetyltransferase [Sandaracinaceae bacterium]
MHDALHVPRPEGALSYRSAPFDGLSGRDVHDLLALRSQIFVVEQACVFLDPDGRDPDAWHVIGRDAAGVIGASARLFLADAPRVEHVIGRVVVHSALRGTGEGRRLVREAIACAERHGASPIALSAQAHLERFYASLGFRAVSERYLLDGIDHLDMRRG